MRVTFKQANHRGIYRAYKRININVDGSGVGCIQQRLPDVCVYDEWFWYARYNGQHHNSAGTGFVTLNEAKKRAKDWILSAGGGR